MNKTVVLANDDLSEETQIRDISCKLFDSSEMIERAICLIRDLTIGYSYREKIDGFPSLHACEIGEPQNGKGHIVCMHEPTREWLSNYKSIFTKLEIVEEYLERLKTNVAGAEEQFYALNEDTMNGGEA